MVCSNTPLGKRLSSALAYTWTETERTVLLEEPESFDVELIQEEREEAVTLGLYRNRSVERIKGNQATFDNSQRNNLRSRLWGFSLLSGHSVLSSLPFH